MWIDAHAHLYGLSPSELALLIDEARSAGVTTIVNAATGLDSSRRVVEQAREHVPLVPVAGISPFDAANLPETWDTELLALARCPGVAALGEMGLDTTNPLYPPLAVQVPVFERQLEIARSCGLPVVVHSRGSERMAAGMCKAAGVRAALFHCFTGSPQTLKTVLDNNYFVSFSGIVTFNNSPLDDTVAAAPLDRIFIETDSPYLAPVPHRGKPNRPAWVGLVGERVARLKGCSAAELSSSITRNFDRLFGPRAVPASLCAER